MELLKKTNKKEAKDILEEWERDENDNETKIDLANNYFKYHGKELIVLRDNKNDIIWIKGKAVAEILGYENTTQAIIENVDENDKINFEKIDELFTNLPDILDKNIKSLDKKTIFINESGLYSLILSSKKPYAKEFKHWITSEVLPSIRKIGSYSIQNKIDVPLFYTDNLICDYDHKNIIYIAYIGQVDGEQIYKFGKTSFLAKRDIEQHRKTFLTFEVVHISECDNKDIVEMKFRQELRVKNILRELTINDRKQTELFTVTSAYSLDSIIKILTQIVEKFPLQALQNKECEHKEVLIRNEQDLLIEKEHTEQKRLECEMAILIEQEKTKQEMIRLKKMELEIELKKLEFNCNVW